MPRRPSPDARDRILDTAARLFDKHGVRAVGLQQIIDECGCGKNLLYREFPSKDELVAAYVERCSGDWDTTVEEAARAAGGDPAEQLVAIVRIVTEQATCDDFRGCAVRNTLAEFPDPDHPAHRLGVDHARTRLETLRELARQAGADDPAALGDRIMLILDGVNLNGAVLGAGGAATAAADMAREVVRTALPAPPAS